VTVNGGGPATGPAGARPPSVAGTDDAATPERPDPGLFAAVAGQPAAVAALRAAARQPVHAYLLHGSGSATRVAARAFAAALLCPHGGCNQCEHCRRALLGTHPDLVVVERTGAALGIDEARRLIGLAQRRPLEAPRQVLVVPDAQLAVRSVPALLKTVEEPPASTVFVLLAEDIPPELVTLASRCVVIPLPPVPAATVRAWLEERDVEPARAALIAEGSQGDLDRARLLAEDPNYLGRLELWRAVPSRLDGSGAVAGALARELREAADAALGPLRARHEAEQQARAEEAEATGERGSGGRRALTERQNREERRWRTDELRAGLGVLARAYRDRMVDATSRRPPAGVVEARGCTVAVDLITELARSLERNPNEGLQLEALLVRLGNVGV
jgi:DNA polymerase-3 subunit delta'